MSLRTMLIDWIERVICSLSTTAMLSVSLSDSQMASARKLQIVAPMASTDKR